MRCPESNSRRRVIEIAVCLLFIQRLINGFASLGQIIEHLSEYRSVYGIGGLISKADASGKDLPLIRYC